MTTSAHLLIQADPGTSTALRSYLEQVPGVVDAAATSGPFDAVARVEVADEHALQQVLVATRSAPGLARLCLCRKPSGETPVTDASYPCPSCSRYTCRCDEPAVEPPDGEWVPWWSGFAANA
jgi:hypothetical protein